MLSRDDVASILGYVLPALEELSIRHNVMFVLDSSSRLGAGGIDRFDESRHDYSSRFLDATHKALVDSGVVWLGSGKPDYVVNIGTHGLYSRFGQFAMTPDIAMSAIFVSIFHEMRHVQQYNVARGYGSRPADMPVEVLCSLVSSCDNIEMYHVNYRMMPHEIDAEHVGVVDAHELMSDVVGQRRADRAMGVFLSYSTVFCLGPMRNFNFVVPFDGGVFSDRSQSLMKTAIYSCRDASCLTLPGNPDFAARYLSLNERDRKTFLSLRTGAEQDAYLAKINVAFNDKERAFFDRDVLSLPDTVPEPLGGVLTKSVAVVDERRPIEVVFFDDVADDELQF